MEEEDKILKAEDLVKQFGLYDAKLDLPSYQIPNLEVLSVDLQRIMVALQDSESDYILPLLLSNSNGLIVRDLYQQPNVLLAGTIASGKTQFLYNQLAIWIARSHPAMLKLVICRSKPVDYNAIAKVERHFLAKLPSYDSPIAEGRQVGDTIEALVKECDDRLDLFSRAGVKNIKDYNNRFVRRELNPEQGHRYIPNIVLIMDDLQTFLDERTTNALISLTQMNLYTGVYVLAVTSQIMSRSITPQLRANFGIRIGMKLMSQNESRKILDRVGAEKLAHAGELVYEQGDRIVKGMQPYMDHSYMHVLCDFIGSQKAYPSAYLLPEAIGDIPKFVDFDLSERDLLFEEAARLIVMHQQGSTSLIQRKLKLGCNRAGRIMDQLEAAGIVGPFKGSHAREVLYPDEYSLEQYLETLYGRDSSVYPTPARNKPTAKDKFKNIDSVRKEMTSSKIAVHNSKPMERSPLKAPHKSSKNTFWIVVVIISVLWYWFSRG